MIMKEIVHAAQLRIQASTANPVKKSHIYETIAACFGYSTYASFIVDSVFAESNQQNVQNIFENKFAYRRFIELGYRPDFAAQASSELHLILKDHLIGVVRISSLVCNLKMRVPGLNDEVEIDLDESFEPSGARVAGPILLASLNEAASKGNNMAHYALALLNSPNEEDDDQNVGSSYWYSEEQKGQVLSGVQKQWAVEYENRLKRADLYSHHLHESGRLGNLDAMIDLADQFGNPTFFEQSRRDIDTDPAEVAAIAERIGRDADARLWLTDSARRGNTNSMLKLIEAFDQDDLLLCWTWIYLSKMVGIDLTSDAFYPINDNGSDWDDDVGGPVHVAGREGVSLEPLSAAQDYAARLAAEKLFEQIIS